MVGALHLHAAQRSAHRRLQLRRGASRHFAHSWRTPAELDFGDSNVSIRKTRKSYSTRANSRELRRAPMSTVVLERDRKPRQSKFWSLMAAATLGCAAAMA